MDLYQGPQGKPVERAERKFRGISGSTLKMIAVVTMLIDHIAAGVLGRFMVISGADSIGQNDTTALQQWIMQNQDLFGVYSVMRMIGRIAFPIYCFLLVQGFVHTGNRMKYAARLFLFAVISEVPFDLLFNSRILETGYQNVFFTLFFGLMAMIGLDWVQERKDMHIAVKVLLNLVIIGGCMALAANMKTDYAEIGVACIVILYLFRNKKGIQILAGCASFMWELTAPLAFVPIAFYNGKRGWNLKYFFYLFYPVHLLLLYFLSAHFPLHLPLKS